MNVPANEILVAPRWRLGMWAARAWRRMGWRHVLLGLLIFLVQGAIHPLGGIFFAPVDLPGWDPVLAYLDGTWAVWAIPIVYCALVADEAFDDGVAPLRAYGLAVVALAVVLPVVMQLYILSPWRRPGEPVTGWDEGAPQHVWWSLVILYESSFGLSIYAYWRVTQRAIRQAQVAETERVRDEQRVQTARLLALQSRVDPQLLFDALEHVGALSVRKPQAADALLADLIALLRSMQTGASAENSTVEREFALVEAWLRVMRSTGHGPARVRLDMACDARPVGIAPMLVLPLLREVLAFPRAARDEWLLSAEVADERLLVTLKAAVGGNADAHGVLTGTDLRSVHDRLAQLFGHSARLAVSPQLPSLTLDLPRLQEEFR